MKLIVGCRQRLQFMLLDLLLYHKECRMSSFRFLIGTILVEYAAEMTQRVVVLLDVLFICGSNACTKSCGISPQGKQSFVVGFVPLVRIYNPCSIMALPCRLSGCLNYLPQVRTQSLLLHIGFWVWFFSLCKINI
jgi:hypothetical protein